MAWIDTIEVTDAEGLVEKIYRDAESRAGHVFHILRLSSLNPRVLRAWIQLYVALMHEPSPLSRAHREALAVTVSRLNHCHY